MHRLPGPGLPPLRVERVPLLLDEDQLVLGQRVDAVLAARGSSALLLLCDVRRPARRLQLDQLPEEQIQGLFLAESIETVHLLRGPRQGLLSASRRRPVVLVLTRFQLGQLDAIQPRAADLDWSVFAAARRQRLLATIQLLLDAQPRRTHHRFPLVERRQLLPLAQDFLLRRSEVLRTARRLLQHRFEVVQRG